MNPRIKKVIYQSPHKLLLTFANEEERIFDFSTYLSYPVYHSLQNESFCYKATVVNGTVVWDDIVDFDPDTLYLESESLYAGSVL